LFGFVIRRTQHHHLGLNWVLKKAFLMGLKTRRAVVRVNCWEHQKVYMMGWKTGKAVARVNC